MTTTTEGKRGLRRSLSVWQALGISVALMAPSMAANINPQRILWSGSIGTLIQLVAYVLATLGCIKLVFIERKLRVPQWQVVIPVLALAMLGYTIYRNVFPYPTENPGQWLPAVAFGWVALITIVVLLMPSLARRLTSGLARADEGAESL
jgi:hypothetical protein